MECLSEKVSGAYRTAPRQSRGAVLDQKRTDGKRSLFRDVRAVARDRDAMKSLGTRVSRFEPRLQSGGRLSASSNEDGARADGIDKANSTERRAGSWKKCVFSLVKL